MRLIPLAAVLAALFVSAAPAYAGDPIMPLSQVQPGMQCTGYSVIQGTTISSFNVQVLDIAGGEATGGEGARILISVSGPAVDATGIGPGFSGSPIYCTGADGVARNIGAISESVGAYGGKEALATPIQDILGTPVQVPGKPVSASKARALRTLLATARPLAEPLTVSGLSAPVAQAATAAYAKAGQLLLATPPGPLASFPPQVLRPGSAVATGYSDGDIRIGAIGTVAYVDGNNVWAFGHSLEDAGRRALLLQDAYVFGIINNPLQINTTPGETTYKYAASGHDIGTLTDDGDDAVVGTMGPLPHLVPVHVLARDLDSGVSTTVDTKVADEAAVDLPSGGSWTSVVAPLAVAQAATDVLGSLPGRVTGTMCARITLQEIKSPLRFCNRYVSTAQSESDSGALDNAVTTGAANDLGGALSTIDTYTGKPPHVTGVDVELKLRTVADQAFMRSISLPRHVRAGQKVRARVSLQVVRGNRITRSYTFRIPANAKAGTHQLRFVGHDADAGDDSLTTIVIGDDSSSDEGGDPGPTSLNQLADSVRATGRYDGVSTRIGHTRIHAFRDPTYRISGQADAAIDVSR